MAVSFWSLRAEAQDGRIGQQGSDSLDSSANIASLSGQLEDTLESCESGQLRPSDCARLLSERIERLQGEALAITRRTSTLNVLRRAKIELFAAYLNDAQESQANSILSDLISVAPLNQEELLGLGPKLARHVRAETQKMDLRAHARIEVYCDGPCIVSVNDSQVDIPLSLPLGRYRLVVSGIRDASRGLRENVNLTYRGQTRVFHLRPRDRTGRKSVPDKPEDTQDADFPKHSASVLPTPDALASAVTDLREPLVVPVISRNAIRIGMGVGLLATVGGTFISAMSEWCQSYGPARPNGEVPCRWGGKLETEAAGAAALLIGASILITGTSLLIVERVRGKRAYRAAQKAKARSSMLRNNAISR